jgi:hypothetical protein
VSGGAGARALRRAARPRPAAAPDPGASPPWTPQDVRDAEDAVRKLNGFKGWVSRAARHHGARHLRRSQQSDRALRAAALGAATAAAAAAAACAAEGRVLQARRQGPPSGQGQVARGLPPQVRAVGAAAPVPLQRADIGLDMHALACCAAGQSQGLR